MRKKQIILLILFLVVGMAVSGCGKKPLVNNQPENNTVVENRDEVATTTEEKEYTVIEDNDSWTIFKSSKCDFEVSFPKEFEWSGHCENVAHPNFPQLTYLSISNSKSDINNYLYKEGDMSLSIINTYDRVNETKLEIGKKEESYDIKNGSSTLTIEGLEFLGQQIKLENYEIERPMEGPPFLKKLFYFKSNDKNFMVSAKVYFGSEKGNDLFYEIVKTIKLTN